MRAHNVGVLISTATARSVGADNDSQIDRESGSDLADALGRLGLTALPMTADDALDLTLRRTRPRACLLAAHGVAGGLGHLQALLEMRKIPFVGPSAQATGLAYDKLRARQILAYHSLPVPTTLVLGGAEAPSRHAIGLLGWPCVLKPRRGSHAAGVRLLSDRESVAAATEAPLDGGELLIERAVLGREVQVVTLHGKVLGLMEVTRDPDDLAQIRSMTCPPSLSRSQLKGISNLAEHAVRALGLTRGAARVDILVHPRHNEVVLEAEPCPALHRAGVVAKVARAAGLSYEALVQELLRDLVDVPERVAPSRARRVRPVEAAPVEAVALL
jgi:D-alanine-D-alanine ligase